ncbi:DUF6884 domain-containing protein [Streptomyces sp. NPDC049879]|uniref:DUF6884 domain-containing protein n=1 Tax=Streptomyces sp. NPDC049879 TaxID=3365598 RepID=UPI00378D680F
MTTPVTVQALTPAQIDAELAQRDRLPVFIRAVAHNDARAGEYKAMCDVCAERDRRLGLGTGRGEEPGRVRLRWGADAQGEAERAAWDHAEEHRAWKRVEADAAERLRHGERAAALRWSEADADVMRWAAMGWLHWWMPKHRVLYFCDRTQEGRGPRVAHGRVEALAAAGLLTTPDPDNPGIMAVVPTADGREALRVWKLCRPEPVVRSRRIDAQPRPLLPGGQEERRRADLSRAARERAAGHPEEAEERDRQGRAADAAPASSADAPAGRQPQGGGEGAAAREETVPEGLLFKGPEPVHRAVQPSRTRRRPARADTGAAGVQEYLVLPGIPAPRPAGPRLPRAQRVALRTAAAHPEGWVPFPVNLRVLRTLGARGWLEWTEPRMLCGQAECDGACCYGAQCRAAEIADCVWKPCAGAIRISESGRHRIAAEPREQVVIVPCGKKKAVEPYGPRKGQPVEVEQAGRMYVGSYHLAARRAADALTRDDQDARVLILSAKYGLLPLDRWITAYDTRPGDPDAVSGETLRHQAHDLCVAGADVTVLAGQDYVALAREAFPGVADPLGGSRGIGDHQARLARISAAGDPAAVVRQLAAERC